MTPNQMPRKLLFTSIQNPYTADLQSINLMRILSANSDMKIFVSNLFIYLPKMVHTSIYMQKTTDNFKFTSGNTGFLPATFSVFNSKL